MVEEEKQERKTLSIDELLTVANGIEKTLCEEHHLSSAEIMFIGTVLQASATTDYTIHNLIKKAQVIKIPLEPHTKSRQEFKPGEN